ncbi:hypothetical protein V5799_022619 [Amblyomma americanum]|uniref:limulus clotting factor C n=1 Tax=Amblyomma americanum TaxID=6943 RepID=A0AAQ4FKH1_AMBAM
MRSQNTAREIVTCRCALCAFAPLKPTNAVWRHLEQDCGETQIKNNSVRLPCSAEIAKLGKSKRCPFFFFTERGPSGGSCRSFTDSSGLSSSSRGDQALPLSYIRWCKLVGVWMRFGEKPYCGGVIVSWLFVMTAGHCTRNKMAQDLRVSFGVTHINHARLKSDQKDHLIEVEAIYQNPLFKDIVHGDDISILKMSSPLQEGGYPVTPICIPEATGTPITTADIVGTDGVVAGWGRTTYGGESSKQLREVALPIVSNKACAKVFKDVLKIRDEMICAGDINGTKDACQGDSGGALMWRSKVDDRWYALGVVSFGVKCAEPGYYGTYTRVQSYLVWICKVTDGLLCFGSSSNEAGVQLPSNSTKDKEE